MPNSKIDESIELTNNKYCISVVRRPRTNQRRGTWGIILIEGIDEQGKPFLFQVAHPFKPGGFHISRISNILYQGSITSFEVDKEKIDSSELGNLLHSENIPIEEFNDTADYSYKKVHLLLNKLNLRYTASHPANWEMTSEHLIQWNPFARLAESKKFPNARIIRSSLWERIKDVFFILNGSFYAENKLGLLDYLFPFPRILTGLIIFDNNELRQIIFFIPAALLLLIRSAVSLLLTTALLPIVIPSHFAIETATYKDMEHINALKVKPIKGEFEDIADLDASDFLEETTLGSYGILNDALIIKPIKESADHYEEVSKQQPLNEGEHLSLGLFQNGEPRGILDLSPQNYKGIFSLMKRNQWGISQTLEETNTMDLAINTINT